jgi:Tol biopolymer transport system component
MILFGVVLSKWPVIKDRLGEEAEVRAKEAESSRVSTLVPDPASDPAISPDGKLVAFRRNSYTPGGAGIFVTSSESKAVMQLTQHPGDCCPAWSPDGKQIAFTRIATDEYGIYVVSARGGAPRKISHEDPRKKRGELAWTPDGKYIAFSGDSPQGGSQIFVVSVEDSSVHAITEPQGQDRDWGPAFSPDDAQMAFVRGNGAGFPEEVYVMTLNGGPPRQLTNERAAIMGPPHGRKMATASFFLPPKKAIRRYGRFPQAAAQLLDWKEPALPRGIQLSRKRAGRWRLRKSCVRRESTACRWKANRERILLL